MMFSLLTTLDITKNAYQALHIGVVADDIQLLTVGKQRHVAQQLPQAAAFVSGEFTSARTSVSTEPGKLVVMSISISEARKTVAQCKKHRAQAGADQAEASKNMRQY